MPGFVWICGTAACVAKLVLCQGVRELRLPAWQAGLGQFEEASKRTVWCTAPNCGDRLVVTLATLDFSSISSVHGESTLVGEQQCYTRNQQLVCNRTHHKLPTPTAIFDSILQKYCVLKELPHP